MLFHAPELNVVLATVHVPLSEVPRVADARVDARARSSSPPRRCRTFGCRRPRIAVAGLNPHAGEDGLLGTEETSTSCPRSATLASRASRSAARFPADTVFTRATRGEFDVVIACYHDQGLIPVKLLSFGRAVNVTIGLPIVRTSVDHGTAFDIAGKGVADPGSMIEAVLLAARARDGARQTPAVSYGSCRRSATIVGHRRLTMLLSQAIGRDTLPPTLMFAGPGGVGKFVVARAVAARDQLSGAGARS